MFLWIIFCVCCTTRKNSWIAFALNIRLPSNPQRISGTLSSIAKKIAGISFGIFLPLSKYFWSLNQPSFYERPILADSELRGSFWILQNFWHRRSACHRFRSIDEFSLRHVAKWSGRWWWLLASGECGFEGFIVNFSRARVRCRNVQNF